VIKGRWAGKNEIAILSELIWGKGEGNQRTFEIETKKVDVSVGGGEKASYEGRGGNR